MKVLAGGSPAPLDCSRDAFLDEQEYGRKLEEDWRLCRKQRMSPGFEKIMKLRYPGGKKDV